MQLLEEQEPCQKKEIAILTPRLARKGARGNDAKRQIGTVYCGWISPETVALVLLYVGCKHTRRSRTKTAEAIRCKGKKKRNHHNPGFLSSL